MLIALMLLGGCQPEPYTHCLTVADDIFGDCTSYLVWPEVCCSGDSCVATIIYREPEVPVGDWAVNEVPCGDDLDACVIWAWDIQTYCETNTEEAP